MIYNVEFKINAIKISNKSKLFAQIDKVMHRVGLRGLGSRAEIIFVSRKDDADNVQHSVKIQIRYDTDADKVISKLIALHGMRDFEANHKKADDLVYDFLIEIGYKDVAEAYEKVGKLYS